jgi:hypothetical protein
MTTIAREVRESSIATPAAVWARLRAARGLWTVLAVFTITRLGIALVAYLAEPLIVDSSVPPYHARPDNIVLDVFGSRWDTGFYLSIADEGYQYYGERLPSVAFFPLLPLLIRAIKPLTGGDSLVAGLLITNAALLGASALLYRLACEEWGPDVAGRAVWYCLIFPPALFGSAIYSESLFLLCALGALYAARHGRWGLVGPLGIAATLTRLLGLSVVPLLVLEWWQQRRARPAGAQPGETALFSALLAPLGTVAYMLYLKIAFGDPLAFAHAAAQWGREPQSPLQTVLAMLQAPAGGWLTALFAGRLPLDNWIDLLFVLLFLALGLALVWQRRWGEGAFVLLGTLLPLSSGLLMSQRRYVWVLFPVYILLARWGARPWFDRALTAFSLLGLALFTALFANWYWVG